MDERRRRIGPVEDRNIRAGSVGSEQKDVRGRTKEWSEYQIIPQLSLLLRGEMMSEERSEWSSRRLDLILQIVDRYVVSCCRGRLVRENEEDGRRSEFMARVYGKYSSSGPGKPKLLVMLRWRSRRPVYHSLLSWLMQKNRVCRRSRTYTSGGTVKLVFNDVK